jgi:hypothetical protein
MTSVIGYRQRRIRLNRRLNALGWKALVRLLLSYGCVYRLPSNCFAALFFSAIKVDAGAPW